MSQNSVSESDSIAVEVKNLAFGYDRSSDSLVEIPDWRIAASERLLICDESGSGKSTLLNLLAGILLPQDGSIEVCGTNIVKLSPRQRDRFRAKSIGVVYQQFNLIPYLSALDNVLIAAQFANKSVEYSREKACCLLQDVNLGAALFDRKVEQLSIGQQQRVAIVRALINEPALLLVDEPTSALDHKNRDLFMSLLFSLIDQFQCTLVFVSHDIQLRDYFSGMLSMADICHQG